VVASTAADLAALYARLTLHPTQPIMKPAVAP
jgi:hypothetical protein